MDIDIVITGHDISVFFEITITGSTLGGGAGGWGGGGGNGGRGGVEGGEGGVEGGGGGGGDFPNTLRKFLWLVL